MKKSRSKRPSYKKLNRLIILISVVVFGFFIYRKMIIYPVEINQIAVVYPSPSPSPSPTPTPTPNSYPSPSPVMEYPPSPSPLASATAFPYPIETANPSAMITCQAQIYKLPVQGPYSSSFFDNFNPEQFIRPENKRNQFETVKGGEYYLVYPRIENISPNSFSTIDHPIFRGIPSYYARQVVGTVSKGSYSGYLKNGTQFVYLDKLQMSPYNGADNPSAYFVYHISEQSLSRILKNSFKLDFDLVGPGIMGSAYEQCGSLVFRRQ